MTKTYVHNLETGKIELHFSKAEYQALPEALKSDLKSSYLFSGKLSAWVSRSVNNHYSAINTANKLGFTECEKVGERLSYAEEVERQVEKAEARTERFDQYADNAEKRAEGMQAAFNENRKDWSWLTQPNISSSAGRSFTNQRNKIMDRYAKGFDEYRKSEYFKQRSAAAQSTAEMAKFKDKVYLNNRIEESSKRMRELERLMATAEERGGNEARINEILDKMEYELDKLAYLQNCMEDLGGVTYSKDNVKLGYNVKVRGRWGVVKMTGDKNIKCDHITYPYAEIQDINIPSDWEEVKKVMTEIENTFVAGDFVVSHSMAGKTIIRAYQVVKTTDKTVTVQQVKVIDNIPVLNDFVSDKQERKGVKKDRRGQTVVNDGDWYLFKYTAPEVAQSK